MSIMSKLFCRDDIGIDLGAANMRVWIRGEGLVLEEPSAVALDISHEEVKEKGKTPSTAANLASIAFLPLVNWIERRCREKENRDHNRLHDIVHANGRLRVSCGRTKWGDVSVHSRVLVRQRGRQTL